MGRTFDRPISQLTASSGPAHSSLHRIADLGEGFPNGDAGAGESDDTNDRDQRSDQAVLHHRDAVFRRSEVLEEGAGLSHMNLLRAGSGPAHSSLERIAHLGERLFYRDTGTGESDDTNDRDQRSDQAVLDHRHTLLLNQKVLDESIHFKSPIGLVDSSATVEPYSRYTRTL